MIDECNEPCPPLIFKGDMQPARCGRERGHSGAHVFRIRKNGKPWCECAWGDLEAEGVEWPANHPLVMKQ